MFSLQATRVWIGVGLALLTSSGVARADTLHWIDGGPAPGTGGGPPPVLHTIDLANLNGPIVSKPISNLNTADDEHVSGLIVAAKDPFALVGQIKPDLTLLTETGDPTISDHRRPKFFSATGNALNSGIINDSNVGPYVVAGYQQRVVTYLYPNNVPGWNSGQVEFSVAVDAYGNFFHPDGIGNSGTKTTSIGQLQFSGSVISTTQNSKGRILVLTNQAVLYYVQYSEFPGKSLPLAIVGTVHVTFPSGGFGSSIINIAMAPNKQIYSLVRRYQGSGPHQWGDIILCRGAVANATLPLAFVKVVATWGPALADPTNMQVPVPMVVKPG